MADSEKKATQKPRMIVAGIDMSDSDLAKERGIIINASDIIPPHSDSDDEDDDDDDDDEDGDGEICLLSDAEDIEEPPEFYDTPIVPYDKNTAKGTGHMRVLKELNELVYNPPPMCIAGLRDGNLYEWVATIMGSSSGQISPHIFRVDLSLPCDYPFVAPIVIIRKTLGQGSMAVNAGGNVIQIDIIQRSWSPVIGINAILLAIQSMLTETDDKIITLKKFGLASNK